MVDEHGSWCSSTLTIGEVEEGIVEGPWVQDAEKYPRPWSEIPDWRPVKQQFTEESWTAKTAAGWPSYAVPRPGERTGAVAAGRRLHSLGASAKNELALSS